MPAIPLTKKLPVLLMQSGIDRKKIKLIEYLSIQGFIYIYIYIYIYSYNQKS